MLRIYKESDIFQKMNRNNSINDQLMVALKSLSPQNILNPHTKAILNSLSQYKRDSITPKLIEGIQKNTIILATFSIDKRFPANIPFVRTLLGGKPCVVVDLSKYATVQRNDKDEIINVECDIGKLYSILVPAYLSIDVLYKDSSLSLEATKYMALAWSTMFNKILRSQRVFINSEERYATFMYLVMKFFMKYYTDTPDPLIDKVLDEYLDGPKPTYLQFVEANIRKKDVDIFKDWSTFVNVLFSNEVTNLKAVTGGVEMSAEQFIQLFSMSYGRDGSYMALWGVEYFFFCIFATYNKGHILNDRNWDDVVNKDTKLMPKLITAVIKNS